MQWTISVLLLIPLFVMGEGSTYFIAIKENEGNLLETLDQFIPLIPPKGRYYADPFLLKREGVNYLFFEDYDYKKGIISYVTVGAEGFSEPKVALELEIHLSFPSFFEEDHLYMIPETYSLSSVSLYKCIDFPTKWERHKVLIQGDFFSDPILFKQGDYYWLFAAVHRDHLVIYYSKEIEGPFFPHPINRRRRIGRNAGAVFTQEGKLIRPVMDCSKRYGRSMILKEIVLLTPSEFIEKPIALIEPNWAPGLVGTHTYSLNEDYLAYDGEKLLSSD